MAEIKITADASQANNEISKLDKSLNALGLSAKNVKSAFTVITAAAAGVGYAMARVTAATGELNDTAALLGVSAAGLNNLQKAAQQAGVGADQLTASMFKLRSNIGDALVKGTGPANDALKRLGLSAQQLSNQSLDKTFADVTKELGRIPNQAERSALAMDLFGKTGAKITEITAAADAFRLKMEQLGVALTDLDSSNVDAVGDAFESLQSVMEGGLQKALSALAPYLISVARAMERLIGHIVKNWESILPVLKVVGLVIAGLAIYFSPVIVAIAAVTAAILKWPKFFGAVAQFILDVLAVPLAIIEAMAKALYGVGAALVAIAQGKNPFDAYKAATKDFSLMPGFLKDTSKVQTELTDKAQAEADARKDNKDAVVAANQEHQKALIALGQTLEKLGYANQYEREKINLGEEQATINKRINEEAAKLKEKGVEITQGHKDVITLLTQEEFAIKRQNEMWSAQKSLIEGLVNTKTPAEKATADIQNLRTIIEGGKPIILPIKFDTPEDIAKLGQDAATKLLQKRVDDTAKAEISKYDRILAIKIEKEKALADIDEQIKQVKIAFGEEELIRTQALEDAKTVIKANARASELQAEIDLINEKDKIKNLEVERDRLRMEEQFKMQKGLFGERVFGDAEAKKASIEKSDFEKKTEKEKNAWILDQASTTINALGSLNKKAFEAAKAFNIAKAIMNTYAAASEAFFKYGGWPLGALAAAATVATGLAQVAQIRSQQYSGRALGGPVMNNTPYLVGENGPELFTPNTTGSITRNSDLGQSQPVNVNFTIVANDTQGFDQLLASRKGVIQQIISDAMLEKGQRSMM